MRYTFLFLVGLMTVFNLNAQKRYDQQSHNYRDFASKPFFFGLALGYNQTNFKIFRSGYFFSSDTITAINSPMSHGFNVSVISNLKVGESVDFRLLPTFSFTERKLNFALQNSDKENLARNAESVFIELPFQIRYKTDPYKDMRAFILGGAKYTFDVSSKNRTKAANDILKIASTDFSIEIGGGLQFFMPFFIFSPEIKYSHGLNNILIYSNNKETSKVLDKLYSRTWTISLNFEG